MSCWQSFKGAVVSSVNVKFLRFTYAFTIALIVGLLTLAGVAAITYFLVTTCSLVCRSIPLALVASETVSALSCVAFKTRALTLSVSPLEQSRAVFTDLLKLNGSQPSTVWNTYAWTTPAATLGKCSYQHATSCALQEWLSTFQGLVAIAQVGNGTADTSTAAWPGTATFYSKSTALDRQRDAVAQAAAGTPRLTVAAVTRLLSAGAPDLSSNDATLLQAPDTAACCDITNSNTKLGQFGGGSSRFVVNIKGHSGIGMNISTCGTNTTSTMRCSWVELSAAMVVPPQDVISQKICAEYWNQGSGDYEMLVGLSASICQSLGVQLGTYDVKPAPHQICLNGSMTNIKVLLSDYYTVTGACPTTAVPLPAVPATATPKPWAQQQSAGIHLLLPLAHDFGMSISWYMTDAQVDIASAAQGLNAIKNDNEAASWWMENYLYCCSNECNSWLSSIGSALGYETYIEGGVALIVLFVYLSIFKPERIRLGLTNLKGISAIAFESQDAGTAAVHPDTVVAVVTTQQPADKNEDKGSSFSARNAAAERSSWVVPGREEPHLPSNSNGVQAWTESQS